MGNQKIYIHELIDDPRPRAREVHAPHDRELVPDRTRRARAALLRRLGHGRQHRPLARSRERLGGRRLGRARAQPDPRDEPSRPAGSVARRLVGRGGEVPARRLRPRAGAGAVDAHDRRALPRGRARRLLHAHEIVQLVPGRAQDFLERVREVGVDAYGAFGLALLGAFRTALRNDSECVLLWAIPRAEQWAEFERAQDGDAGSRAGATRSAASRIDWRRTLLVDAPLAPLRTGASRRSRIGGRWRRSPSSSRVMRLADPATPPRARRAARRAPRSPAAAPR